MALTPINHIQHYPSSTLNSGQQMVNEAHARLVQRNTASDEAIAANRLSTYTKEQVAEANQRLQKRFSTSRGITRDSRTY